MKGTVEFDIEEIEPSRNTLLQEKGMSKTKIPREKITILLNGAYSLFRKEAKPIGMISTISKNQFSDVYRAYDQNDAETPLADIFPMSNNLALFAITLGEKISKRITRLFDTSDFAQGYLLDKIASFAADRAADLIGQYFFEALGEEDLVDNTSRVLPYSPGYCGWHISAQDKLFRYLKPKEIGIRLNSSSLMIPLKSVSGVLVVGKKHIHEFETYYPVCKDCKTHECRERIWSATRN